MPFNVKKMIILGIFNFYLKKFIKDFDYKVLNKKTFDETFYVCLNCTRFLDPKIILNFNKLETCIYCKHKFIDLNSFLTDSNMNYNNPKILSL